jgi:hypothetical protein
VAVSRPNGLWLYGMAMAIAMSGRKDALMTSRSGNSRIELDLEFDGNAIVRTAIQVDYRYWLMASNLAIIPFAFLFMNTRGVVRETVGFTSTYFTS